MAALGTLDASVRVRIPAPQLPFLGPCQLHGPVRFVCEHMFVPGYTKDEAAEAVAASNSFHEVLCRLGLRPAGGNHKLLRRWLDTWQISTEHFDPGRRPRRTSARRTPISEVLVEHSAFNRGHLKARLYAEELKQRECELCGQGEQWQGARMSLILDHINGIGDDNRLENLRIVCPNCNATLETHCGRQARVRRQARPCPVCGDRFEPGYDAQRFCSRRCGARATVAHTSVVQRKVQRPSYDQLMAELAQTSFCAVARRYGVSDNAVRKWVRWYEADVSRRRRPQTDDEP
jgi:transposase-like protein